MNKKCSIIIPTWNESKWLPRLLNSIINHPYIKEIIVVDNNSSDRTVKIAQEYGCITVNGGLPGISRNIGAKLSKSEIIIFIDADTIVPHSTIYRAVHFLSMSKIILYYCRILPITSSMFIRFCYKVMDIFFRLCKFLPIKLGIGNFFAINKATFFKIGGFCTHLTSGEDADFFRRASKVGKILYDTKTSVYVSPRRFYIESPIWFCIKTMIWTILRLTPLKIDIFKYCWKKYPTNIFDEEARVLSKYIYDIDIKG